jgi:two-component system cell cycle response regulator DivK
MSYLNLENKKILVVEDDDLSFLYLNHLLRLTKVSFIREKSGIDAIERFRNDPDFDLILMDLQLPDMDGKQVTQEIRKLNSEVPIIAQTASKSAIERDLTMESGCTAMIIKPFTMEELFGILGKYIAP